MILLTNEQTINEIIKWERSLNWEWNIHTKRYESDNFSIERITTNLSIDVVEINFYIDDILVLTTRLREHSDYKFDTFICDEDKFMEFILLV